MEVLSGMNNSAVRRLKGTWRSVALLFFYSLHCISFSLSLPNSFPFSTLSPFTRSLSTHSGVSKAKAKAFEEIQTNMSHEHSYKLYRTKLHTIDPPLVPYMGMYLTDMVFIEEGNKGTFYLFLSPSSVYDCSPFLLPCHFLLFSTSFHLQIVLCYYNSDCTSSLRSPRRSFFTNFIFYFVQTKWTVS